MALTSISGPNVVLDGLQGIRCALADVVKIGPTPANINTMIGRRAPAAARTPGFRRTGRIG
jgi:hypothetical protein